MIVQNKIKFIKSHFQNEAELEKVVLDYSEFIFGPSIIFIPKSKISTAEGAGTIPDGFVIDVDSRDWFLVEAELAEHGVWAHIVPQISRQLTACDSSSTRQKILNLALEIVKSSKSAQEVFSELDIPEISIHSTLEAILKKSPIVAIPIDHINEDLKAWANTLKYPPKIWLIEKYLSESGEIIYSFPEKIGPSTKESSPRNSAEYVVTQTSDPYQEIWEAKLIKDGEPIYLEYGPRGSSKKRFEGKLRKNGVELDGQVMSLSAAAIKCIQRSGSPRETANGWAMWKVQSGKTLNDVWEMLEKK